MAEGSSRAVRWLIASSAALAVVVASVGAAQADDYEVRALESGQSHPPEKHRLYPEVATPQAALEEALRRLRARGAVEGDLKVVLHRAHWIVPKGKEGQVWPVSDVDTMLVSPWLALRPERHAGSVGLREIHVLAFQWRVFADFYGWHRPENLGTLETALSSIDSECFIIASFRYRDLASPLGSMWRYSGFYDDLTCLPPPLRDPLFHFFEISSDTSRAPSVRSYADTLKECWSANQDFYSRLYEAVILRALSLGGTAERPDDEWWRPALGGLEMTPCGGAAL